MPWETPPLNVPEYRDPDFYPQPLAEDLLDITGTEVQAVRMPGPLGHDDHLVRSADVAGLLESRNHFLVPAQLEFLFGNQHPRRPASQGSRKGQVAAMAPHGLEDEGPLVRRSRRVEVVHGVNNVIEGRVRSDGHVRSVQIVVDGTGKTYDLERRDFSGGDHVGVQLQDLFHVFTPFAGEGVGAHERPVAADDHQCLDSPFQQVEYGPLPSRLRPELLRPGGSEESSPLSMIPPTSSQWSGLMLSPPLTRPSYP